MKNYIISAVIVATLASTPLYAQQAPDPDFMSKAIGALQQQRNTAYDAQAIAEAKLALVNEALAKANAKVKELEEKLKPQEKKNDGSDNQ